jgi:hypothetical protein
MIIKVWSPEHLQNHAWSLRQTIMQMGHGIIMADSIYKGDDYLYILYCPQVLNSKFPDDYIVYHTEHAERFLLGNENRRIFENAKMIWCHTPETIVEFNRYYPHIKCELVPPGFVIVPKENMDRIYNVTFYGNLNERRQQVLDMFENNGIKVNVITKLFGEELLKQLLQSKIVLNLHYAHPAPLELFRIHEALSMGCHVVSEKSSTEGFKIDYTSIIHFMNDPYKMILWTKYLLDNQIKSNFDIMKLDNRPYLKEAMKKLKK